MQLQPRPDPSRMQGWWPCLCAGVGLLLGLIHAMPLAAAGLDSGDTGTFMAIGEDARPLGRILHVSRQGERWHFHDRQPDGSWLDVSCHGGCEHTDARAEDLVRWFGSAPPEHIRPQCIRNTEYAFCRFEHADGQREGYVLVLRIGQNWLPVNMVRLPDDPEMPVPDPETGPESDPGSEPESGPEPEPQRRPPAAMEAA